MRGPSQFNIDMSLIVHEGRPLQRGAALRGLQHLKTAQFQNPNRTIGNAAVAQISAMLQNPACALCGTTERNIRSAAKYLL